MLRDVLQLQVWSRVADFVAWCDNIVCMDTIAVVGCYSGRICVWCIVGDMAQLMLWWWDPLVQRRVMMIQQDLVGRLVAPLGDVLGKVTRVCVIYNNERSEYSLLINMVKLILKCREEEK